MYEILGGDMASDMLVVDYAVLQRHESALSLILVPIVKSRNKCKVRHTLWFFSDCQYWRIQRCDEMLYNST
jgi:hypothetical protein